MPSPGAVFSRARGLHAVVQRRKEALGELVA